jgi:hypothetical protein
MTAVRLDLELGDTVDDEVYSTGVKVQKGLESGAFASMVFGRNERGNQIFQRGCTIMPVGPAARAAHGSQMSLDRGGDT